MINVTAYNLHSEPDFGYIKYTHNMTRIINVQIPVENFTIDFGTPAKWLDTDGGQCILAGNICFLYRSFYPAYEIFLKLDSSTSRVPTEADLECDFGDNSKLNTKLDSLEFDNTTLEFNWKITHSYAFNGKYNVTCR